MHSLTAEYLDALSFDAQQLATLRKLGECLGRQTLFERQAPEVLEGLKHTAVIESTESSNRLEGIELSRESLKSLLAHRTEPHSRSEQEIAGYRDALSLVHEVSKDMPFSTNVILQLHQKLNHYMPMSGGEWKRGNNEITERHADGTVRVPFTPVAAHLTPSAMQSLVERFEQATVTVEPLVIVPLAILDFLCIHPFTDGNGRIARLLTLTLLYRFGYSVGRFISLERLFESSKVSYYETLEASSHRWHEGKHDWRPWLNFFWGVLIAAHREFENRVGHIQKTLGGKSKRVRQQVLARTVAFSISDIEMACPGVSRDTIRSVLRALKADGSIEPTGKGRSAKWKRQT